MQEERFDSMDLSGLNSALRWMFEIGTHEMTSVSSYNLTVKRKTIGDLLYLLTTLFICELSKDQRAYPR